MVSPERKPYENGVVFVDFDGCISICNWRELLLPSNNERIKGYDKFHEMLPYDPPNHWMINMMERMHDAGIKIIVLTGRMKRNRIASEKWLSYHSVKYDWIQTRANDDFRPSEIYKAEYVNNYFREEVKMIFDDRTKIIDHFNKLGYPTFKVTVKV